MATPVRRITNRKINVSLPYQVKKSCIAVLPWGEASGCHLPFMLFAPDLALFYDSARERGLSVPPNGSTSSELPASSLSPQRQQPPPTPLLALRAKRRRKPSAGSSDCADNSLQRRYEIKVGRDVALHDRASFAVKYPPHQAVRGKTPGLTHSCGGGSCGQALGGTDWNGPKPGAPSRVAGGGRSPT